MAGIRIFHLRIVVPVLVLLQVLFASQIASAAKPPPPPLAPTTLAATPYSTSQINLAWNDPNTGSGSPSESGYEVERVAPPSTSWSTVFTSGPNVTSWSNTGLGASTTYSYRVRAFTVGQQKTTYSGYSPVATAATAALASTNRLPVANAGPSTVSTQTLTSTTFNGSGSSDPDGTITSYAWTFGDGGSASGMTVSHAYATAGSYTVRLTVTDNLGATGSTTVSVTVMNRPPVANAGPDRTATVSTSVTLNGSGSSDPDGTIATYFWNFGDGTSPSSGSVPTVTHAYATTGAFNAILTVTDNKGATASDTAVITVTSAAAGGAFGWAKRFGSSGMSSVLSYSTAVDTAGNVVVAGTFSGSVNFGGGALTSAGGSADIFVAKFTSAGTHLWSRNFGGTLDEAAYGVAVDGSGNIAVVGTFMGTISFGGGPLIANYNGVPPQTNDIFVAKLSSSGGHVWSRNFGSWSNDAGNGVAFDSSGNVVVVGTFLGNVDFGGVIVQSVSSTPDIFLAKYSAATGQLAWARGFGSAGIEAGNGVAVDGTGNVIMTGLFRNTVDFGGGPVTTAGSADIVVAKYSPNGVHLWSKAIGGTSNDAGYAVKVDGSGNIILTGYVAGTVDFGGGATASIGAWDTYVAKYSPTGGYLWAKRFGGTLQDEGLSIAADTSGNVFVTGAFQGTADFGRGPLTSAGAWDVIVSKYSASGAALWSKRYGNTGNDLGYAIAADGAGNAIVTGAFQGAVDFGGGALTSTGWSDMFLLKLGP